MTTETCPTCGQPLPEEEHTHTVRWQDMQPGDVVSIAEPGKKMHAEYNRFEFVRSSEDWSDALMFTRVSTGKLCVLGKHNEYVRAEGA